MFRAWIQGVEAVPFSGAGVLVQLCANRGSTQWAAKHVERTEAPFTFVATTEPSEPPALFSPDRRAQRLNP